MVVIVGRSNWMHVIWVDRAWDVTLAAGVAAVLCVGRMVAALHLTYHEKLNVLRTKFIPAALHGIEAFLLSQSCYTRLRVFCPYFLVSGDANGSTLVRFLVCWMAK